MKSMIVLAVLLVASSLAQENPQQAAGAPEGDVPAQLNVWQPPFPNPRPPGRPWWPWSAEQRDERQVPEGRQEEPRPVEDLPEASNYAASAEAAQCCFKCVVCIGRKKRSIMPSYPAAEDIMLRFDILGSSIEMKLYNSVEDIRELYNTPVSRVELYERPLDPATPPLVAQALGYKQSSVVVTLKDGRRFMLVKGDRKGEGRQTILILADHMTDDWVKVQTKDITRSVLLDFAKAGGLLFDALRDNGSDAARRMMALS
jgi:hypothetical protein